MQHHEAFLTEDFLRYVAECKHMAGLARRRRGDLRGIKVLLRWADQVRSLNA